MRVVDTAFLTRLVAHYGGKRGERQRRNIAAIGPLMPGALNHYAINTPLRQAHFLAQVCEESYALSDMEEEASGAEYEGRVASLGNTQPGDGARFKGRGLIQVTGRANYRKLGDELHLDLLTNPKVAGEPQVAVSSACQYWADHHLNVLADKDDIQGITRRVNGKRMLGLRERSRYLQRAKQLLSI